MKCKHCGAETDGLCEECIEVEDNEIKNTLDLDEIEEEIADFIINQGREDL